MSDIKCCEHGAPFSRECDGCAGEDQPVIRVEFTKLEAQILWPVIQERAEQLAEELEHIAEEHRTTQELADILYHQLERIGGPCGE